jgi:putative membrane protein
LIRVAPECFFGALKTIRNPVLSGQVSGMKRFAIAIGCTLITVLPVANAKDSSSQDQAFVNEAARGGKMEVELGQLAERNGSSSDVKAFGAHMVKDHTRLNNELGSVATSIGLTVPADLSAEQKREYTKLSKVSGKSFDRQYIDLMVKDHTEDLAAFQKAESTVQDPKLKKAISSAIPVIQEHLHMAKSDAAKVAAR